MEIKKATIDFFANAKKECPTNFGVTAVPRLFPETVAVGTIHNAICNGVGPDHRKVNGRIILERDSFLEWLCNRPKIKRNNKSGASAKNE